MHPERIAVGDFHQPFGIGRTGMDQGWKSVGGYQWEVPLGAIHFLFMNMALDVTREAVLGPFPVREGFGKKFLFFRRRSESY